MYLVGKILTSHGIKGEVKVKNLSDFNRFYKNNVLYIDKKTKVTIENVRNQQDKLIVKFKEFNNINEIINLKNINLYSDQKITKDELDNNEYFIPSLIDLKVYNINDDSYIGYVKSVICNPSQQVLEIYNEVTCKKVLVPFVDEFISNVDLENKTIKISPIEGML